MDLRATTRTVLTPQMGCQPIETDFKGPLPKNTVGLLLGRSSSTLKGLVVHPGVIDQDYTGQVKAMCSSPRGIYAISPGDRVAQLLVLPSLHNMFSAKDSLRGDRGFGSSGVDGAFLSVTLDQRPIMQLQVEGKQFQGIMDTGADTSIISSHWWPSSWPINQSAHSLQGLGYESAPMISARILKWMDEEGNKGTFQPYILPLPVNLWGRDVLTVLKYVLTNNYSNNSQHIMESMGGVPGKGLDKKLQGHKEPVPVQIKLDKKGLGFS